MTAPTARWWTGEPGAVRCGLCPHGCRLGPGSRGVCRVRENRDGRLVSLVYGAATGFAVDPVEKKPLYHYRPGTRVLSFGTTGCPLSCRFCQNWRISQAPAPEEGVRRTGPAEVIRAAQGAGCSGVAFTYNEPAAFAEFALDTADLCRSRGLGTVAVSAGYFQPAAAREFFSAMDAANIDLKAFTDGFYRRLCGAALAPVLETLGIIRHETGCWLEITTLLIPGENDSDDEVTALSRWIRDELGPDVPLHFSAFHPDHRMLDRMPTPPRTVVRARDLAREAGLLYVYTGNLRDPEGGTTVCPGCGTALVRRQGFQVLSHRLGPGGACPDCRTVVPGRFR